MAETPQVNEQIEAMRHSASHVMAEAVLSVFPEAKLGIGPAIDTGFYYDFELPRALTPEDLPAIEEKMKAIKKQNLPFTKTILDKEEAKQLFADQPYKLEIIDELPDEQASIYKQGTFTDLCRGPHVRYTSQIGAFKLVSIAGAYWRGDEKRPMLQRIYAAAFKTQAELDEYLNRLAELEARDHRKINKQLGLFATPDEVGGGLIIYGTKSRSYTHHHRRFLAPGALRSWL